MPYMTIQQSSLSDTQYKSLCSFFFQETFGIKSCSVTAASSEHLCLCCNHSCLPSFHVDCIPNQSSCVAEWINQQWCEKYLQAIVSVRKTTHLEFGCFYGLASCIKGSEVMLYFTVNWNINAWISIFQYGQDAIHFKSASQIYQYMSSQCPALKSQSWPGERWLGLISFKPENGIDIAVSKIQEPDTLWSSLGHWSWSWATPCHCRERKGTVTNPPCTQLCSDTTANTMDNGYLSQWTSDKHKYIKVASRKPNTGVILCL